MFRKLAQFLRSLIQKTSYVFIVIAGIQLLLMIFITTYGVIMRYFLRRPEPISYEICTIFLLWSFIFAISEVERLNQHITSDIFIQFAPERVQRFLRKIITPVLGLIFSAILTWKGWSVAMYSYSINERSTSVWAEPIFPIKVMIPICYALLTIVLIDKLFHNIASYDSDEEPGEKLLI